VGRYIVKRLLLLPLTLFLIVLVNFIIINLAPGEPFYLVDIGKEGEARARQGTVGQDERYLQFREFFGLTLPILCNTWPWTSREEVLQDITLLISKKNPKSGEELSQKKYSEKKVLIGDRSRFVLPHLLYFIQDSSLSREKRKTAFMLFLRGACRFSYVGVNLSEKQRQENRKIAQANLFLDSLRSHMPETDEEFTQAAEELSKWYDNNKIALRAEPTTGQKIKMFFFETRFWRYFNRVLHLDFGVMRSDSNRTVISEVASRMKYSLTLSIIPLIVTFFLCTYFGLIMAIYKDSIFDVGLNFIFLIFWATPVFVVAPFLISNLALHHNFPFTDHPFPIRGFSSDDAIFSGLSSWQALGDIARHITLPLITIFYGSLAVQSRLSRAIFLDTLGQEYVRSAIAKGVKPFALYVIHVGRNAASPILTSVAGSLGVILGGSVIVETIFEIHGFGKFFYDAIIDRDYNVMLFSALAGSFLALLGYLIADITYMILDPRVTLEEKKG
jgi:peptide/nickel transport system permease protein